MQNSLKRKKKVPVLGLLLTSLFLIVILSLIFLWVIVFREYRKWEGAFELERFEKDYITLDNTSIKNTVDEKLKNFAKSNAKVDFVEITDKEFMYLVGESLNKSLPLEVTYQRGYVESEEGIWHLYIKTERKGFEFPWIVLSVVKDNTESPEIYIQSMSLGNFDFTDYGARIVIDRINKGIRDAILLVNESDFTGRVFRNIELEKGKMTIKGEK